MVRTATGLNVVVTYPDDSYLTVLRRSALVDVEAEVGIGLGPIQDQFLYLRVRFNNLVGSVFDTVQLLSR